MGERVVAARSGRGHELGLPPNVVKGLQWFLTFNVVCLAWVFFRAQSIDGAFEVLGQLFTGSGLGSDVTLLLMVTVVLSVASQFVPNRIPERAEGWFRPARTGPADGCPRRRPGDGRCPRSRGHRPVHLLPVLMTARRPPPSPAISIGIPADANVAGRTGTRPDDQPPAR